MSIQFACECGRTLRANDSEAGRRAHCPTCGQQVLIPQQPVEAKAAQDSAMEIEEFHTMEIAEFLDPPIAMTEEPVEEKTPKEPILRRMFEALLDPRSIQWMLTLGGGLLVLGLIVLLVNLLNIEMPYVIAGSMGVGTLAILAGGWFLTTKTKYRTAGRALTFLACVVTPLNLWYYHAQDLFTLQNHLWIGGVVCSLMYVAIVRVFRDPLFMYAVEAGVTLTVLLFLPVIDVAVGATAVSIALMVLGLITIHAERGFLRGAANFPREQYGPPLFWSGQLQTGVSLLVLLGSQFLSWLDEPIMSLTGYGFQGNLLTNEPLIAGLLWLAGTYIYLYSDFVLRRLGVYVYVAAFCMLMGITTLVGWLSVGPELVITVLAVVALAANLARNTIAESGDRLSRVVAPLGMILSGIPLLIGWVIHLRATSLTFQPTVPIEGIYVIAMLVVAGSNRVSAWLSRNLHFRQAAAYLFFTAAALLMAAAGLLPLMGVSEWSQQAPLLILIPLGYILASRMWRGQSPERPLAWISHAATGIVLFHVLCSALESLGDTIKPVSGELQNLMLGIVFAQAAVVYTLAGLFRKRGVNAYFAAAAACGALWQWLGYFDVAGHYHTLLFAVLGVAALAAARSLGLEETKVYRPDGEQSVTLRGRGVTAFQSGNAILLIALLSVFWQGFVRLLNGETLWVENTVLLLTTAISAATIVIVPKGGWRKTYMNASVMLAGLAALTITVPWLKQLSLGEKVELISVISGIAMLVAGHIGRFRETGDREEDWVGVSLFLGSVLAAVPLLTAVVYHRWSLDVISFRDELSILAVTIVMLIVGYSWQTRAPTLFGGGCLSLYLIVVIAEMAMRAEEMLGIAIFMTVIGGCLFAGGIVLSMCREKLLQLPDKIANREGVFRIINWR